MRINPPDVRSLIDLRIPVKVRRAFAPKTPILRRSPGARHSFRWQSANTHVNELSDKTENALKIAGDVYAARLFTLAATRLGLADWKGNVREKLKTLDDIYRFAVEQTAMARGELPELMIVPILVFELVLFFAGIMR